MIKRMLAALAALAAPAALLVAVNTSPAEATDDCLPVRSCGSVYHYTPDANYDVAIRIDCDLGSTSLNDIHSVFEGQSSKRYCYDADAIIVATDQEIWCKYLVGSPSDSVWVWQKVFDSAGVHKIDNWWSDGQGCTVRRD